MKNVMLFISFLLLLASCKSVKNYNAQITNLHAVADLQKDVDKLYSQLQKHHPRLYQYSSKEILDFKFDSLKNAITEPMDSREFYKKLAPVVSYVKQGHISVGSANKRYTRKESKKLKKQKFEFYDLDFDYQQSKLWVKGNKGKDSSIVGSEVVKIENDSISNLIRAYKNRFSSDGYNATLHDRSVGRYFSSFYFKDKGFMDSLQISFKKNDSIFTKTFKRILKDDSTKKVDSNAVSKPIKLTKSEKKASKLAIKQKRKFNKKHGFIAETKNYTRNFRFMEADSTVAYMNLRSFTNGPYRKFYRKSFQKLDSAKTKHLVLDLRNNGGGRISEINYLYSYLATKEYQFLEDSEVNSRTPFLTAAMSNTTPNSLKALSGMVSPLVVIHNLIKTKKRDGKLYYRFKYTKLKSPKPNHFTGDMYVLINGNSFSASSLISTHLQATKRAVFVGEETGGAYNGTVSGIYKIYELPNTKLKVRMGLMHVDAPYKQTPDGYGVKPDVTILPTWEDVFLKKDVELDWVLNSINEKENKP
ncbi:S41 family peptidase [Confluentibacter flavum]|uniref:Peptidase S41 n=1 Tax=Confluentibacter flavum TaxID=1909700 RepID=A0A2N3HMY2_9FLAO|nr:S41 family peptidase [Confluentibacter flavum]PKQ46306.1 peptidase S41 [Confluentibacter flavum]